MTTLLGGVAAWGAIGLPVATLFAAPTAALAQDYTSGTIAGTVKDTNGAPIAGASVTLKSDEQGLSRTTTTDGSGQFRFALIPIGGYNVTIAAAGFDTISQTTSVALGGTSNYAFALMSGDATDLDEIVVTAARASLDFSGPTTGLTVDLEELVKTVPLPRSLTSVVLLAPGAVRGDSAFGDVASIGGSSVAENAVYVNGLNVTNFDNYIGSNTIPFDFYRSIEVKTGGIPAEFGRATGGITNTVTKSGTNDFVFAIRGNWTPDALRKTAPDVFGSLNKPDTSESYNTTFEAGGPILRDRLFFYGLAQFQNSESYDAGIGGFATRSESDDPFYGVKLDGYITPDHRLEYTWFQTTGETRSYVATYDVATDTTGTYSERPDVSSSGGENWVGRYTGTFTDWLTLSAAVGRTENNSAFTPRAFNLNFASDARGSLVGLSRRPSFRVSPGQTASSFTDPRFSVRQMYRADADLYFSFLGDHHIRGGWELEQLTFDRSTIRTGAIPVSYTYRRASTATTQARGASNLLPGQEYVQASYFSTGGSFETENTAFYIQDEWDVTEQLTLNLGVRLDQFVNYTAAGVEYLTFDNEIGPRLGFVFDPMNDGRSRVFGSYSRYYLPVASNTAFRMGAAELAYSEFFLLGGYTPIAPGTFVGSNEQVSGQTVTTTRPYDANGIPIQRGAQIVGWTGASACPGGGLGTAGVLGCVVTARGEVSPTDALIAENLQSTAEDEFVLGYERKVGDLWTFTAAVTYRDLLRNAEDIAIDAAVNAYCVRNRIAGCGAIYDGFHQYVIVNPGMDSRITLSDILPGDTAVRTIDFTGAELGYPEAKRTYAGLELSFERAFDGVWSLGGSWTISESSGNTEGYVKSDNGQTDAGITQDFDQPGLTDGADGLLPNHRGHAFKAFGSYQVMDNLTVGANISVTSPRAFGCIGVHPTDLFAQAYGAASNYCDGKLVPRGTGAKSDWIKQIDMSLRYTIPEDLIPGDLVLRADIFNVFEFEGTTDIDEFGEGNDGTANPNYGKPVAYQAPRSVRIGFDLTF